MRNSKQIALAFPLGVSHFEGIVRGIVDFSQQHGLRWSLLTMPESLELSVAQLRSWRGDGAVVAVNTPADAALASKASFPLVNISGALARSPVPRVTVDGMQIGELAADHLMACGFRHFAYYGLSRVGYAQARGQGFAERLETFGLSCVQCEAIPLFHSPIRTAERQQKELIRWLESLPKPLALFAASDYRARIAQEACHACGLRMPHEVAILGVNNDPILCEHSDPPLSSVSRNSYAVGQQAAAMLQRLMQGKPLKQNEVLVPPDGLVKRASTDVIAVNDPRLAAAVQFLHERAQEPIGVDAVLRHVGVSRRWLEYGFRDALGTTPYEYLCRLRVDRARTLLRESPRTRLQEVAEGCGFSNTKQMNAAFLRLTALTPRQYREQHVRGRAAGLA
jgi:LacI family transcriptional regulator